MKYFCQRQFRLWRKSHIYLGHHPIFGSGDKLGYLEILFQPFKKNFDLPSVFIQFTYFYGRQIEAISKEE